MSARRREVEAGLARGRRLVTDLSRDLEEAVRAAGLSYAAIGRAVGLSGDQVARICRGHHQRVTMIQLAVLFAVVGLDLTARAYPAGDPIRDAAQVALVERLRPRIGLGVPMRLEVPVVDASVLRATGSPVDRRAWDAVLNLSDGRVAVEAETRVRDVQALLRRLELKRRDGAGIDRLILVMSDTAHNRRVVNVAGQLLRSAFPGSARSALRSLRAGQAPAEDALILL